MHGHASCEPFCGRISRKERSPDAPQKRLRDGHFASELPTEIWQRLELPDLTLEFIRLPMFPTAHVRLL